MIKSIDGYLIALGTLRYIGRHNLGRFARYVYYRCDSCGTDYPVLEGTRPSCNGKVIDTCMCDKGL